MCLNEVSDGLSYKLLYKQDSGEKNNLHGYYTERLLCGSTDRTSKLIILYISNTNFQWFSFTFQEIMKGLMGVHMVKWCVQKDEVMH